MASSAATGANHRRRRASARADAGFSLLEVLVATTLMALVLVVLLQVLTAALRAQEACLRQAEAVQVAEKILQEVSGDPALTPGTYGGQDRGYAYRVQVTPQYELSLPHGGQKVRAALIQVSVTWQERGRSKSLALETIRTGYGQK